MRSGARPRSALKCKVVTERTSAALWRLACHGYEGAARETARQNPLALHAKQGVQSHHEGMEASTGLAGCSAKFGIIIY